MINIMGTDIKEKMCKDWRSEQTFNNAYNLETWGDYTEELQYKYPDFYNWLEGLEIRFDDEKLMTYEFFARRPYYRVRGKRVTEEQAFEIIRRCDDSFDRSTSLVEYQYAENEIMVHHYHLASWLFDECHFPVGYGWCYPDGSIGVNNICGKYPNILELLTEFTTLLYTFPYLDLMFAYTECNEELMDGEKFEDRISLGICLHDNVIEILNEENAWKRYREYAAKYERFGNMYEPMDRHNFAERQKQNGDDSLWQYALKCSEANARSGNIGE